MLIKCKIQTMCVKSNIRVSFTPPGLMGEDCVKILYYRHHDFTICQRVLEIRMSEENLDSSKQLDPDFSQIYIQNPNFLKNYIQNLHHYIVYGYDHSQCLYEVQTYAGLSVLQKFEIFIDKIPHDSPIAFLCKQDKASFVPVFVKPLLRHLQRKTPIDAEHDSDIVQTWLSNNEPSRDLIASASAINNVKAKFIINLYLSNYERVSLARNATSQYTFITLPCPSPDEKISMKFLSSEENKQSDKAYSMHRNNLEQYLRKTF